MAVVVQAIVFYEGCMKLCNDNPNAFQNYLLALNYIHPGEAPLVCEAHADWGSAFLSQLTRPLPPITRSNWQQLIGGRKLRVGYLSPDLYRHSVSYFAEAPLGHHNRVHMEVCACWLIVSCSMLNSCCLLLSAVFLRSCCMCTLCSVCFSETRQASFLCCAR